MPTSLGLLQINPAAGPPDLFVRAADGVWCPTYEVRERVIDRVYATTYYAHHPTAGVHAVSAVRLGALYDDGRVRSEDPRPAEAPASKPRSRRLVSLPLHDVATLPLLERLRRLLNARASSLETITGDDMNETRHRAVADATNGRTSSSMDRRLTDDEMGHAVSYVEDLLYAVGFDFEAEDAAYFARRLRRMEAARPAPYAIAA